MLTRIAIVAAIFSLVIPAVGFAQGFSQGDKVLSLNGSGLSDKDFDNSAFSVSGDLSYFFTNNISGAIRQTLEFANGEGDGSSWDAVTRVAADYNFDMGRVWPYVGASIGYLYGDDVKDTWLGGPEAGVKVFVNQTTFIVGSIEWQFLFDTGDDDDTLEDSIFIYSLGIGFRW